MHIPSASPVLPVPEDPLAGVWGSLHLSFRIYVFIYLGICIFLYFGKTLVDQMVVCCLVSKWWCCRSHSGPQQ